MRCSMSRIVYIVTGQKTEAVGPRARRLARLSEEYEKVVLVTVGKAHSDDNHIAIAPFPNPAGIFRVLGLIRLKRLVERIIYFPSKNILFVWAARFVLIREMERTLSMGKSVSVLTTVPPHDVALLGLFLKKKFPAIRWIVDWRDLWTYDAYYASRIPWLYRRYQKRLEKEIVDSCDLNITTNPNAKNILENLYGVARSKVHAIPHAFCRDEIGIAHPPRIDHFGKGDVLRIAFLGDLNKPPKVPGEQVISAFRYLNDAGVSAELHVIGAVDDSFRCLLDTDSITWLRFYGQREHREALQMLRAFDFLLAVQADLPNSKVMLHAKLPDYLLVDRPILAIVPTGSAVSEVIEKTKSGVVIPADQHWGTGLQNALRDFGYGAEKLVRNDQEVEHYSWQCLKKQWVNAIGEP